MDLIKAIILGLIQGLTEFLPVSSSGHLVIFAEILNFTEEGIAFEVFVHFGTLLSVLVAFRKDIAKMLSAPFQMLSSKNVEQEIREYWLWDLYIIVGTIPAVIVGLGFKDTIEGLFNNVLLVYFMLIITGAIMFSAQFLKEKTVQFNYQNSFLIGIAQAFAILPGISRSGSTIFTGLACGLNREKVARFSFLLSIPAILGAVVLKTNDLIKQPPSADELINLSAGTIVAFISGYFAIFWLLDIVKKGKLQWFGYYCFILAAAGITWYFFG
ncbi:MAG: undecaprenyl-diphosphatase UppP [Calditrichaceae bacterium]|nr:undecaprenyl-diphosphatase UppP [Calditrichaceae bacterium]MBN2708314.1 undecaprenyl-diphosphatase UppP [Calditrichaceae bacterium]RQV97231.1 MAG: undecaprenyl-diphosphatase UppP [Calditrichota bacterium]